MKAKSILIIEDEHALGSALSLLVTRMGHLASLVASASAGLESLEKQHFDAAVIDIGLPDQSGLGVLEAIRKSGSSMPVLVITAHATLRHAIDSQKQGATAYMNKPLNMEELKQQLAALLESGQQVASPSEKPAEDADPVALIGTAPCLRDVFIGIARATRGDFPVVISGPGGSGKTLAARLIHAHGRQSERPLHEVDCTAVEEWLSREEWQGCSLIFENLTALKPAAQSALAGWLQSTQAGQPGRIIATMSENPQQALEQGILREDLHFAFKPCSLVMPPLRERSSDIPALCHFFSGIRNSEGDVAEITPAVMKALQAYDWPGNVRELKHVLNYAVSMSGGGPIFLSHLPESMQSGGGGASSEVHLGTELELAIQRWVDQKLESSGVVNYDQLLQSLESDLLNHLMTHFEEKPTRLAEALNIHRGTLRQKLQRIGWQKSED